MKYNYFLNYLNLPAAKVEAIHWVVCESNQEVPCHRGSDGYWVIVKVHVWFDVFPIVEASLNI